MKDFDAKRLKNSFAPTNVLSFTPTGDFQSYNSFSLVTSKIAQLQKPPEVSL